MADIGDSGVVPRPLRIEYPGAVYHLMARGNNGRALFKDDQDRARFLDTLQEAHQKTGCLVHAYVLMGNHYHLLLETPEGNLVAAMKWLQGTYTQRFNSRHQVYGHLFQGRYKAVVVDGEDPNYLQFVSTYIHLNPARAGLIRVGQEKLKSYRWSSYPFYLRRDCPEWLQRDKVLGSFGLSPGQFKGYEACLESRVLELGIKAGRRDLEEQWEKLRRGWYLGDESFLEKLKRNLGKFVEGLRRESHSGEAHRTHDRRTAEELLAEAMQSLELTDAKLLTLSRGSEEKAVLAWWLRRNSAVPLRWVAERLRMGHFTRVSQAVSRVSRSKDRKLAAMRKLLLAQEPQT